MLGMAEPAAEPKPDTPKGAFGGMAAWLHVWVCLNAGFKALGVCGLRLRVLGVRA